MSDNNGTPAWMKEENIKVVASNPVLQSAAIKISSDKTVQAAAVNAATNHYSNNSANPAWAVEPQRGYVPPTLPGDPEVAQPVYAAPPPPQYHEAKPVFSPDELKEMKRYHLYFRVAYMITAILMAACAVVSLKDTNFTGFFIACYVFMFSVLICCFEVQLKSASKIIASNFGFMYNVGGRIFLTFVVCGMVYKLGLFGKFVMGILIAVLIFQLVVYIKFPKFEKYLRTEHYFADKNG